MKFLKRHFLQEHKRPIRGLGIQERLSSSTGGGKLGRTEYPTAGAPRLSIVKRPLMHGRAKRGKWAEFGGYTINDSFGSCYWTFPYKNGATRDAVRRQKPKDVARGKPRAKEHSVSQK